MGSDDIAVKIDRFAQVTVGHGLTGQSHRCHPRRDFGAILNESEEIDHGVHPIIGRGEPRGGVTQMGDVLPSIAGNLAHRRAPERFCAEA